MAASGAVRVDIGDDQHVFIGEDRTINIDVNQADGTTAQNMNGWALTWELTEKQGDTTILVSKTVGSGITIGDGDATDDRAAVTFADTDTESGSLPGGAGLYWHVLRRTDAGSEAVIAYGSFLLQKGSVA